MAIFSITLFCIIFSCLILLFSGIANPFIYSFAVDEFDSLYIGTQNEIRVYADGILINTLNPQTSRAYVFTINEDGNILLSTSTRVHIMDLDGKILDTSEDLGADMYNQIQHQQKFISANGDEYRLADVIGWTHITKNGVDEVYRISTLSFIVKISILACVIALFVFPAWMLRTLKDTKTGDGSVS